MNPVMNGVLVIAEGRVCSEPRLSELLRVSAFIASLDSPAHEVQVVLAGPETEGPAQYLTEQGLDVTLLDLPETGAWDLLKQWLIPMVAKAWPRAILFPHTTMGREVAPALALNLSLPALSNITRIRTVEETRVFSRPVLDNTRIQEVTVSCSQPVVMTLAPGRTDLDTDGTGFVIGPLPEGKTRGKIVRQKIPASFSMGVERLSTASRKGAGAVDLAAAPVVAAIGRGIGDRENLALAERFAEALPKAVLAVSRPLVDQGWIAYDRQVGITGAVVSPDLYIALGISGSSQHLAGMAGARWVVSVNTSADAPMCRHADLCIEADIIEFMTAYLNKK